MDHVVYVDAKAKEMEKLLACGKQMILRGAAGRKLPYGKVIPMIRLISSVTMEKEACRPLLQSIVW